MLWIESQSTPVIALIVFGLTYLLTAMIFCLTAVLSANGSAGPEDSNGHKLDSAGGHSGSSYCFSRRTGMGECRSRW
jgi:hypothetical protein